MMADHSKETQRAYNEGKEETTRTPKKKQKISPTPYNVSSMLEESAFLSQTLQDEASSARRWEEPKGPPQVLSPS